MSENQTNQTEQEVETPEVDKRLQYILDEFGYESKEDVSDGDYNRIEDQFVQGSNELIYEGERQLDALVAAGFTDLADKIKQMSIVSGAYDWTRENL